MRLRSVTLISAVAALAALTLVTPAAAHGGRSLTTSLTGAAEVPGPGDPDGSGSASIRFRHGFREICFEIQVVGITLPAMAAHIHQGTTGVAGPVVVTLTAPNAVGASSGCVSASRDLIKSIAHNSDQYYVNVHTGDYPNGAVRGQLGRGGGGDHHDGDDDEDGVLRSRLSGANERPGPGDPDGRGTAVIALVPDRNEICFILIVDRISLPATAAHIHQGTSGVAGSVVVTLTPPGATGTSAGCVGGVSSDLLRELKAHPEGYYVNVHTADFPNGAVRGQLSGDGGGHDGCDDDLSSPRISDRREGGNGCDDD